MRCRTDENQLTAQTMLPAEPVAQFSFHQEEPTVLRPARYRPPFWFLRLFLLSIAGWTAVKAQMLISQPNNPFLTQTLQLYLVATICFLLTVAKLSPPFRNVYFQNLKINGFLFFLILSLAAFFRLYKLSEIPSGLFFDMGMEGLYALKILKEGWFSLHAQEPFHFEAVFYGLATWFSVFEPTQWTFFLYFSVISLVSFFFIYWTFRQIAGPQVALLTLFFLAVMRWHVTFSRNGFPNNQMLLHMFATSAFLLYGLRTKKTWSFISAAFFFGTGLYTYQSYKIFPVLLFLWAIYECFSRFKKVRLNKFRIVFFLSISIFIMFPRIHEWKQTKSLGQRERMLSIFSIVEREKSWDPFFKNLEATALMFHRRGDPNPRHNLQDHRMLDHVSGVFLILGLGLALTRFWKRWAFYALSGFFIMSLPCLLSIDAAHANRMLGVTPFIAFLCAQGLGGMLVFFQKTFPYQQKILSALALFPLVFLSTKENFITYFEKQARHYPSWREHSIEETTIGNRIQKYKDSFQYYISPRYYNHPTVLFLGNDFQTLMHPLHLPKTLVSLQHEPHQGALYALEENRLGVLKSLQFLYRQGRHEPFQDILGQTILDFFMVPPESLQEARGLQARPTAQNSAARFIAFPEEIPEFNGGVELSGSLWIEQTGVHRFFAEASGSWEWILAGKKLAPHAPLTLAVGWYETKIRWTPATHPSFFKPYVQFNNTSPTFLDSTFWTSLPAHHGLMGSYYANAAFAGRPLLVEWDPTINFVNGNDFSYGRAPFSVRWSGKLQAPKNGLYHFQIQRSGQARLLIDGKEVIPWFSTAQGSIQLSKGFHDLILEYKKPDPWWASLTLYWQPPDQPRGVIPMNVFGKTQIGIESFP